MDLKNKTLFQLSKKQLARNEVFKDRHKGESCYIFGNGISLKEMDLTNFSDKVSLGCTFLWLHKDFNALDVRYYATIAPFWFYPIRRHPITKKMELNCHSSMQKRLQKQHPNINFFTSLSNRFGVCGSNVYYVHHFNVPNPSRETFDLAGAFYYRGVIDALIGMAIYMGFTSAYLVGFDYTHSPQRVLHFYEKGHGTIQYDDDYNADFLKLAQKSIDLTTITTNSSTSKTLKYIDYNDLTASESFFRENTELVSNEYLDTMALNPDYFIY